MKPRIYQVSIRKDLNAASRGLYPGGGGGVSAQGSSGNFEYRYIPIVTGTIQEAMSLGRSLCGKDEEIESVSLQSDDPVIDPNIDIDSD